MSPDEINPERKGNTCEFLTLIIDGNNLAGRIFPISANPLVRKSIDQRLNDHLSRWLEQDQIGKLRIDLCLDGTSGQITPHKRIQIHVPNHPKTADDEVLERFYFHSHNQSPCVVITDDGTILDEVDAEEGYILLSSQFVEVPSPEKPRFISPERILEFARDQFQFQSQNGTPPTFGNALADAISRKQARSDQPTQKDSRRPKKVRPDLPFAAHLPAAPQPSATTPASIQLKETIYRLVIEKWPVEAGLKFLMDSFCAQHRNEHQELMVDFAPESLRSSDLITLASFLVDSCSEEPDFVQRGGSLMDKIRLALLKAGGDGLTLPQLAAKTGFRLNGLHGRIKERGKNWVEISKPD
jgi:hypothetical protein